MNDKEKQEAEALKQVANRIQRAQEERALTEKLRAEMEGAYHRFMLMHRHEQDRICGVSEWAFNETRKLYVCKCGGMSDTRNPFCPWCGRRMLNTTWRPND